MNVMRLGWTLVHFLWQGALIALIYGFARRYVRVANDCYLLACATLALMMGTTALTWGVLAPSEDAAVVAPDRTARVPGTASARLPALVRAEIPPVKDTSWLRWAVGIWLCGASLLSLRLMAGWAMASRLRRRAVRAAPAEWYGKVESLRRQLGVLRSVGLRVSALVQSPVVVGAWRPMILVPVGMLTGMAASQVEALLVHELAHIRRHDYLVNLLQSVAEALLFYHPAVWWVSGHIRAERERCCDDAAVAISGDVMGYVNALADLADSRSVRMAAAANAGSLTDRIARLLGAPRPAARQRGTIAAAVLLAAAAFGLYAQDAPRPKFQVASVKANTENPPNRMQRPLPGGRWSARNVNLQMMILTAYGIQKYQLSGGPPWMEADGYDIEAKAEGEANNAQMLLMLQSLLADRFKLAVHRESKDLPVYYLAGAKGAFNPPPPQEGGCEPMTSGAPLRAGAMPCGFPRIGMSGFLDAFKISTSQLVGTLATVAGRPVIDQTGFTGTFDVHLKFTPDQATQGLPGGAVGAAPPDPDPTRPDLATALREQLGLKLTSGRGPVEVLVIDHVERPSAN